MKLNFLLALQLTFFSSLLSQQALIPETVQSPNSTSMGKYGEFTASHYTGQANVAIPLGGISSNQRDINLNLSYDGSGIMVDQHPGWVGQNWTLNVGGVITRSVNGNGDEIGLGLINDGYLGYTIPYFAVVDSLANWLNESNTNSVAELQAIALQKQITSIKPIDTEPDIFNFNFMGRTGKFFLGQDGTWKVISDDNLKVEFDFLDPNNYQDPLVLYRPPNLPIKYEKVIKGFKILDAEGYKYTFGYNSSAIEYSLPFFKQSSFNAYAGAPDWIGTAWYLTKVEDYRGNTVFNLDYERSYFIGQVNTNYNSTKNECRLANGNWINSTFNYNVYGSGSLISPVYLKSIQSNKNEKVEFKRSNTVEKKFVFNSVFQAQTTQISNEIFSYCSCNLPPYHYLQTDGFYSYDHVAALGNPFNGLMWQKLDTVKFFQNNVLKNLVKLDYNNNANERLNLLSVQFLPINYTTNPSKYGYSMVYDNFNLLPEYFSNQTDHFGYHDGTNAYWTSDYYNYALWQANYPQSRNSNETYLLNGQLSQINYPTGGRSEFDYEINDYSNIVSNNRQDILSESGEIGGLRIKEIRSYDAINPSPSLKKTYHYTNNYNSGNNQSSGILHFKPTYVWQNWTTPSDFWPSGGYRYSTWSNNILIPLANKFENHIGYKNVIEVNADSSYTIHSFITHEDVKDELPYANINLDYSPFAMFSDKSHMRGKEKGIYFYNKNNGLVKTISNYFNNTNLGSDNYEISTDAGARRSCDASNADVYYIGNAVKLYHNKHLIDSTVVRDYFDTDFVKSKTTIKYNSPLINGNVYAFLASKSTINADNKMSKDTFVYSFNYISTDPVQQSLVDTLKARQRYDMIQSSMFYGDNEIDGLRNIYKDFSGHPMVEKKQRLEKTWLPSFTSSYEDLYQIHDYNYNFLLPTQQSKVGWLPEFINYNARGYPINWTFSNHAKSLSYYSNDFLNSMTEIDGKQSLYEYDMFSRINKNTHLPESTFSYFNYDYSATPADRSYFKQVDKFPIIEDSGLDSIVTISYLDGLGREIQQLNKFAAPLGNTDILFRTEYDKEGRKWKEYNAQAILANQGNFVTGSSPEPYFTSTYLKDPLNRLSILTPPLWHSSTHLYGTNTSALTSPDNIIYPIASLYKNTLVDPDGKKKIVYTDKIGRKIADVNSNQLESLTTYTWYIYDDKNRLYKIIPPGASVTDTDLIFEYRYDGADNITYKKVPDAAAEEYVYNDRDLLIGMRNGILQSQGRWHVTQYDAYGRPIKRGYHNLAGSLPPADLPAIHNLLEEYFYDGYNGFTTLSDPIYKGKLRKKRIKVLDDLATNTAWNENEVTYDIYGRISHTTGINHLGDIESMDYTYDFANNIITELHTITGAHPITEAKRYTYDHQGRNLKEYININNTGEKELSKKTYNHRNEVIQKQLGYTTSTASYLQDIDYSYNAQGWLTGINQLFTGLLPSSENPCGTGDSIILSRSLSTPIKDLFAIQLNYDILPIYAGLTPALNGNISTQYWWHRGQYNQSYSYEYDYLDRVKKSLHGQASIVESKLLNAYNEDFDYDQRGNITKLNRKGMMHMDYIDPNCMQAMTIDSLSYTYAPASNKLMQVSDKVPCQDILQLPPHIERDITYAANQKIMVDHTKADCTADILLKVGYNLEILDSLIIPASCQGPATITVQQVPCDDVKFSEGFSQQSSGNYLYDTSGNTVYDPNKKLTFQYNLLNQPYRIIGAENDTLAILYDATGTLLCRTYKKGNVIFSKRDYISNKEWKNDTLLSIYNDNGRSVNTGTNFVFEYFIKDHLGNVRTTFSDLDENGNIEDIEVQSRNDYYAFGMKIESGNNPPMSIPKNSRLYNEKEMWNEMNLGVLNFGPRLMDPVLGRFLVSDPLSAETPGWNSYHYVHNNPISLSDPTGMKADSTYEINTKTGEYSVIDGNGGDEIDYIQLWNGENKCKVNCTVSDPFPVAVEDVNVTHTEETFQSYSTRYPGYKVHHTGSGGSVHPVDDLFTGGIQKASVGGVGLLLGLLTTSSKKTNPSIVYAIMVEGKITKFGVSGSDLTRFKQSLNLAGEGATGRVITKVIPKWNAHLVEKYFTSLHWTKYGRMPLDQKIPFPVNFLTSKKINPNR